MTRARFEQLCYEALELLRSFTPIDTGNLRYNAIRYEWVNEDTFRIYVDESIAPYMPFTNEKWIAVKWKGAKNPNENWWQSACEFIIDYISEELTGERLIA